jgi:hypothetical protein
LFSLAAAIGIWNAIVAKHVTMAAIRVHLTLDGVFISSVAQTGITIPLSNPMTIAAKVDLSICRLMVPLLFLIVNIVVTKVTA